MSILIPREGLHRQNYVRLGIPKRHVRQATVADKSGRRYLDVQCLAEISGKPFIQVVGAISRADFPEIDLTGVRDRLRELGLIRDRNISWKKGLEHADPAIRDEVMLICHALIGKMAANAEVPVFALTSVHFSAVNIAELNGTLHGLYAYYTRHAERGKRNIVNFMLERLGYGKFESLSIAEQLNILKQQEKISWGEVPMATQCWLVEKLAKQVEIPVFALTTLCFLGDKRRGILPIEIPELERDLSGLYHYYHRYVEKGDQSVICCMLEKLDYGKFESLSIIEQLNILRAWKDISWEEVPLATQCWLVETLAEHANVPVFALTCVYFIGDKEKMILPIEIPELGRDLSGLYNHYAHLADREEQGIMVFMLERLGYGKVDSLSVEYQLEILRRQERIYWAEVPLSTQRWLVKSLSNEACVSVYDLTSTYFLGDKSRNILPLRVAALGKNLRGLYAYYAKHSDRGEQDIIGFMLKRLGYGLPPFNAAGRLFASGSVGIPSQSMYIQLCATRAVLNAWRQTNFQSSLADIRLKDMKKIIADDPRLAGLRNMFLGPQINYFDLSYLDLICLAFQHVPLDEILLGYRVAYPEWPNYLEPVMFKFYSFSGSESYAPARIIGYYGERRREGGIGTLIHILERRIAALRSTDIGVAAEEGLFDPKWLETQRRGLTEIARRIERGENLPEPLKYALGLQGKLAEPQPKLADGNGKLNGFNPAQQYAVRLILEDNNPLVMVHGPAGSGKTHTVAEAVRKLVAAGKRVLYVTPTHKATDVFLERIDQKAGFGEMPILRLGVDDSKIAEVGRKYWVREASAREEFRTRRQGQKGALFVGTIAAGVHFLVDEGAKTTRESLDISDYDVVIIDEASMASKPEVYAVLALAKRGVIIGDHVQLEPFPLEKQIVDRLELNEREIESAQRSLLEELMFDNYPHVLLDRNYRAINPVMIVLAARIFYDERIRVNQQSPYFTMEKIERQRKYPPDSLKIIDTSALPYLQKEEEREGTSYCNYREAELAVEEAKKMVAQGFALDDIAFITPYLAQVNLIKRKLEQAFSGVSTEYLDRWVSTFDGFQGDENKCVIISFVRSNEKQPPETGFVGNYHRVNVGITRAQERMVLIGDWSTLKKAGTGEAACELEDNLSLHTRHIFEELELQVEEFEWEGRAKIIRLSV